MAMKRTQIFLSDQQIEKLEKEKKETGLCKSEILRRALDQYLKNGGGKASIAKP